VQKQKEMAEAWVYVLRCRDGSLYTGWTNDLTGRLAKHADGKASRYTASRLPVELAASWPMADRCAAMREEARIKRLDRGAKLALIGSAVTASLCAITPGSELDPPGGASQSEGW
jgi:putative endonuclease